MKIILLFVLACTLAGCSNIKINKSQSMITYPDESGDIMITCYLSYRDYTPDKIDYEILNKTTKETISGQIESDSYFSQKMPAFEKDKIKVTFNDNKGDKKSETFKVPEIPLGEKLIRQGYTPEQAKELIFQKMMLNALQQNRRARMGQAIQGASLYMGDSIQRAYSYPYYYQPNYYSYPQQQNPMQFWLNTNTGQVQPMMRIGP